MLRTLLLIAVIAIALVAALQLPRGKWRLSSVLAISIALALLVEVVGAILVIAGATNNVLYNSAAVLEFFLILRVVYLFRPDWSAYVLVLAVLGLIAMVMDASMQDPSVFLLVEGVMILSMILCIVLIRSLWSLANTSEEPLGLVPEFWLFIGLLVYFGGMMPVIGLIRFVFQQDQELAARLYVIIPYLCMVRYGLTAYACILQRRRLARSLHG